MALKRNTNLIRVDFESLYLDPNNPRIDIGVPLPGYSDHVRLFDTPIQVKLQELLEVKYGDMKESLIPSMLEGWNPDSPLIVWENQKAKGKYVVVEGNCRLTALRKIRDDYENLKNKSSKPSPETKEILRKYEELINETKKLAVEKIEDKTEKELLNRLPHLLAVRHIVGAKSWDPHARNMYLVRQYRQRTSDEEKLDMKVVKEVAEIVGTTPIKAKRSLQIAYIFEDFKARYESKLSGNDEFSNDDQQFFEQILKNVFLKSQLGVQNEDLKLSIEAAEKIFNGSFYRDRSLEDNSNIFPIAKDWPIWARLSKYDNEQHTSFAKEIDLENPDSSSSIGRLKEKMLDHQKKGNAVKVLADLLESMSRIPNSDLQNSANHLRPILKEIKKIIDRTLDMIG